MMKILGIVSAFYPDLDELEHNIKSFLPWIDYLIIWENTPAEKSNIERLLNKFDSHKVGMRTTGQNEYLAFPINSCLRDIESEDYTHLLIMDQDSCFVSSDFERYINLIDQYPSKDVAAFGPNTRYTLKKDVAVSEVESIILSGGIYPVNILKRLNGFNEELLIDAIDNEYCFRAIANNYKIILMYEVNLEHQVGYRHKHWTGLTIVPYSAQRTYYYLRNTFWLWEKYPEYFEKSYKKSFVKYRVIYRSLKIFLEEDSLRKLKAIFFSIRHFKNKKMGRFDRFTN